MVRSPEEATPHSDRSDVREAYALILTERGDKEGARRLLDQAEEDLEWVAFDGLPSLPLAIRMESVADDFERLGDKARSDEIQVKADRVDPRPPLASRPKPGRPFGRFRPDSVPADSGGEAEAR